MCHISKRATVLWILIALASMVSASHAQLRNENLIGGYSLADGGPVSLASNRPVTLQRLSVRTISDNGILVGGNPAPFESVTTNTDTNWQVESTSGVTIDGIVELDLEVEPNVLLAGQAFDGETTTSIVFNGIPEDWHTRSLDIDLIAYYPEEGGTIVVLAPNGTITSGGIEFVAAPGILTAKDPSPFDFFIPNGAAPGNVTVGLVGTWLRIDPVIEIGIVVAPNTQPGEIAASWGHGVGPTAFPVLPMRMPSLEAFAAPTISCVIPADELVGDLDDNDTVEFRDFLILSGNFGLDVNTYSEGDINCNGTVDFEDFLRLGSRFGQTRETRAQQVPEPTARVLLLVGLVAFLRFRNRR